MEEGERERKEMLISERKERKEKKRVSEERDRERERGQYRITE